VHSNDIRGATITVDPNDKVTPLDRVPLLVRSRGAEVGIRTKAIQNLTSSVAVFVLAEIEIDPAQLEAYQAAVKEQIKAAVRLEPGVLALYSVRERRARCSG
jgi:hypothetical protein